MENVYKKLTLTLASKRFFWAIVIFFVFESLWIAVSGRYALPFDEVYHLGIIKLYAHQWSPFFAHQPMGADSLGAVARDPSYLYHYLASFPYRIVAHFTNSEFVQVVSLRIISVALFALGLIIFRKTLLLTKLSKALIHSAFLFFVLTPVIPFLAAQINYDSLLFPAVGVVLLLTLKFTRQLKDESHVNLGLLIWLVAACLFSSLVKYEFLPVFFAVVLYVTYQLYKFHKSSPKNPITVQVKEEYHGYSMQKRILLLAALLIGGGLFFESYGINTILYKNPIPQCDAVLSVQECQAYPPWHRNYILVHPTDGSPSSVVSESRSFKLFSYSTFFGGWFYTMLYSMFNSGDNISEAAPLFLPWAIANAVAAIGIFLVVRYYDRIFKKSPELRFFLWVIVIYIAVLFLQNFSDYMHLGQGLGIQGRYLLPVLLPVYLLTAKALCEGLRPALATKARVLKIRKLAVFCLLAVCMLEGGGAATFIIRSNADWYWQNPTITRTNQAAQKVLAHLVIRK